MPATERAAQRLGFSLVEMLVVVFIVVIIASLVTLSVGGGSADRELEDRVLAVRSIASYALDEAQFSGVDFGALFVEAPNDQGDTVLTLYWQQRLLAGWRDVPPADELFQPLVFPDRVRLQLLLEGTEVPPADASALRQDAEAVPQWLLFSSGETLPGELFVRDRDSGDVLWRLSWDLLGRFELFHNDAELSQSNAETFPGTGAPR